MDIRQKAINSTKWSTGATIVKISIQIIRLAILTRFLSASDFGLSAIVLMVLSFTNIFSDFGINVAILHKKEISNNEYYSLYWLNVFTNIGLYLFLLVLTPVFAYFYDQPLLNKLIPLAGFDLIIIAIGKQFHTVLQKQINFKTIAIIDVVSSIILLIVAYFTSSNGFGVYSIIISSLSSSFIRSILLMIYSSHIVKIHFKLKETYPFLKIGIYQTGSQILDYLSNYIDVFIIGKIFPIELLGYYTLAKELILKPYQTINSSINSIAISYLSKLQDNILLLKSNYLKIVQGLSFVNFPIYFFLIFFSDIIIKLYYGTSYTPVAPFVTLIGGWGMFASINALVGILTFAMGRTDLNFKWTIIRVCLNPVILIISGLVSIEAVAISQSILGIVFLYLLWLFIIRRLIKITWDIYFYSLKKPLFIAIIIISISKASYEIFAITSPIVNLVIFGSFFFLFYLVVSYFFNKPTILFAQEFCLKEK